VDGNTHQVGKTIVVVVCVSTYVVACVVACDEFVKGNEALVEHKMVIKVVAKAF